MAMGVMEVDCPAPEHVGVATMPRVPANAHCTVALAHVERGGGEGGGSGHQTCTRPALPPWGGGAAEPGPCMRTPPAPPPHQAKV